MKCVLSFDPRKAAGRGETAHIAGRIVGLSTPVNSPQTRPGFDRLCSTPRVDAFSAFSPVIGIDVSERPWQFLHVNYLGQNSGLQRE